MGLQNDTRSDESFLKPFNHKESDALLRCCGVDISSTLIPKNRRCVNDFQEGDVCLFLILVFVFHAIFCMHLGFVVIMSFNC